MFKQFDIVRLNTTKNIHWLSGPKGETISPQGDWSVTGVMGIYLILCKDSTVILAPPSDVIKIANYDINQLFKKMDRYLNPENSEEDNQNGKEKSKKEES